ncbi:hypothetical protein IT775_17070 [Thalassobius aquimarinus]|uniref:DUF1127 domain-containing protein n=2 Tax=Thalassovita aquimarina TaxID=2785917 RepID=A0ABS5HV37_9RHOB|nr:hypothetical protein [Thalassovita aquimarina]
MATQAVNVSIAKNGLRDRVGSILAGLSAGLNDYMTRRSRIDQVQKLDAKSDAELAALGLKREEIPRYVFRDMFYL